MPGPPPALCSPRPAQQTFSRIALPPRGQPGGLPRSHSQRTGDLRPPPARCTLICEVLNQPRAGTAPRGAGSRQTPGSTRGCSGVSFFISREDISSGAAENIDAISYALLISRKAACGQVKWTSP
ncbi:uncharacterized protein LOC120887681 [Ictidomys tridecemlineatus]